MRLIDADHLSDRVNDSNDTPMQKLYVNVLLASEPTIDAIPTPSYRVPSIDEWMERYGTKKQLAGYEKRKEGAE